MTMSSMRSIIRRSAWARTLTEIPGTGVVGVMGWCMGGLLCLMHQGLEQDPHIRNIITVASPIDMHGAGLLGGVGKAVNGPGEEDVMALATGHASSSPQEVPA